MSRRPSVFDAPLIVASNRGPVTFERDEEGELVPRRGSGGLVTALLGALQEAKGLWVATAMSDGDREMTARSNGHVDMGEFGNSYRLRYLEIDPDDYDAYYNQISNGLLWFVHHYLWDTVRSPTFDERTEQAWSAYVRVNRMFAQALAEEADALGEDPVYLIQDYHLALVPRFLRELRPNALIAHFSHTAIAGASYLRVLPGKIREGLLRGMLGADVLGFHSQAWAENFLMSIRLLSGARADLARSRVTIEGREVAIRTHPISVDAAPMRELATTREIRARRRELNRWRGNARLILRVDRLELTKNIVRGFQAHEVFLRRNPHWRGRVRFLALLSPSRIELEEYRAYGEECVAEAERINRELGDLEWRPIEVQVREDFPGAVAAYGLYDVLMVNPIYDGMNLVSMEGPLLNRRHGVLILSRNAGAYWRLGRYAVAVNPFDLHEQAEAIEEALEMPADERARRARGLSRLVLSNPPARWVRSQLEDLERARVRRARTA
ncbi:MAG TPA: trehalose-6-phosphate synthase [Actinomycetota bacterium]|nr:trehalose-6-phosphate synthase [Actinomycetota bacterium]